MRTLADLRPVGGPTSRKIEAHMARVTLAAEFSAAHGERLRLSATKVYLPYFAAPADWRLDEWAGYR